MDQEINNFFENSDYEILTNEGFKDFAGLRETLSDHLAIVELNDGKRIGCTRDHRFITNDNKKIRADKLTKTDDVIIHNSKSTTIRKYTEFNTPCLVYDLCEVEDTHSFFANDILISNCLLLDEFAFVQENIAEEFFTSVYPTISSGKRTKVVMVSTPNGMNLFHRFWIDAEEGRNTYKTYQATWRCRPDRDDAWAKETLSNIGERQFSQEFEVAFLGSQDTLISGTKLSQLTFRSPILSKENLNIYKYPEYGHRYMMSVDCGKGKEQDYSTFTLIDITQFPYEVVAVYRSNKISPILYPEIIRNCAIQYNEAFVLIEVNDIGSQIALTLHRELEYENLLTTTTQKAKQLLRIGAGYSNKHNMGVITSKSVKAIGCSNLKSIIEGNQLIINDHQILSELTTFIAKKNSFEADEGHHDDLVMNLVLFSWAYHQEAFKDLTDLNLKEKLLELKREREEEDERLLFGFFSDGSEDDEVETFVQDGAVWEVVGDVPANEESE